MINTIRLLLIIVLFASCNEYPKELKEYYPSGEVKSVMIFSGEADYCNTVYHVNGNLEVEYCVVNGQYEGVSKRYYDTGELYSEGHFLNGKKNGIKKFYRKGSTYKGFKLFSDDSLFYSRTYKIDYSDSVDQIYPLVDIQSGVEESDSVNISIEIPFTDLFPYRDSTLVVHYTISHYVDKQKFRLPRENSFILDKNKQNMSLSYMPKDTGRYVFFGLITINDEPLKHFNQNFFERELPYYGKTE